MALHRAGKSAREIGEEIGLSKNSVGLWLKSAGLQPNGGCGPRDTRLRRGPDGTGEIIAAGAQEIAELKTGPAPSDRLGVIEKLRETVDKVDRVKERSYARLTSGEGGTHTFNEFRGSIQLEQGLLSQIAELSPREVHDPQSDPANVEQAAETRRKLERLVEHAERGVTCRHCGKNPFLIDTVSGSNGSK
jgi:hypothetical protein